MQSRVACDGQAVRVRNSLGCWGDSITSCIMTAIVATTAVLPGREVAPELIRVWVQSPSDQFLSMVLGSFQKIFFSLALHPFQYFCELPSNLL